MYLSGLGDEAANGIEGQIKATQILGWHHLEMRNVNGTNFTLIDENKFNECVQKLDDAHIQVNCYGSSIANWACHISHSPQNSYDEMQKAIPRMKITKTRHIRIMSFACAEDESINEPRVRLAVFNRIKRLVKMAEDADIICVHENCDNWGGRSYEHTLDLLEHINSPNLKLVFDTGNPFFRKDIRGSNPYPYQHALEYYRKVKDHVVHIHIKDGFVKNGASVFTYPGEGDGHVLEILQELKLNNYGGGLTIEPHLAKIFHKNDGPHLEVDTMETYVEYGRRVEQLLIKSGWGFHKS